jgi:shikimate dehydrogenase
LLDEATPAVRVAGACNAVKRLADGRLLGDQFDGAGFARGVQRKGFAVAGARALVVGCGGVGAAIAAALAEAGAGTLVLFDLNGACADGLAQRLRTHYPNVEVRIGGNDPAGFDLVVNATPMGMNDDDPLPIDPARLGADTFVGEVVMKAETTPLLRAALARGCRVQVGTDMLFDMIPAYLEFFGLPTTTPEHLRSLARLQY